MKIRNKNYNISNKLNKNIVLISDIHYEDKKDIKVLNNILHNIKKRKPNYICIPGDIIHKSFIKDENEFINWLQRLASITKVIISLGNHEFFINKYKKIYGLNEKLINKVSNINNVFLLDNKNIIIDNINFIGFTIPMEYYQEIKHKDFIKCLKHIKSNKQYYNILLCHSPINICDEKVLKKINVELVLCGHMHGGVVPMLLRKIFKNRGFISPYKKLFPKNAYGNLKINKTNIIISSGIKVIPFKILNLFVPEIVSIKI